MLLSRLHYPEESHSNSCPTGQTKSKGELIQGLDQLWFSGGGFCAITSAQLTLLHLMYLCVEKIFNEKA